MVIPYKAITLGDNYNSFRDHEALLVARIHFDIQLVAYKIITVVVEESPTEDLIKETISREKDSTTIEVLSYRPSSDLVNSKS